MIDTTADQQGLTISAQRFACASTQKEMMQPKITEKEWELPGLRVAVVSDAKSFSLEKAEDGIGVVYAGCRR